jgi:hypothetical protein
MYKVVEITDYGYERWVLLENQDTGSVAKCFDDSYMSGINFGFMTLAGVYDCKLALFGVPAAVWEQRCVKLAREYPDVIIGKSRFMPVKEGEDSYYVSKGGLIGLDTVATPYFRYSRIDLIQADSIVHSRYRRRRRKTQRIDDFATRGIAEGDIPGFVDQAVQSGSAMPGATGLERFSIIEHEGVKLFVTFDGDGAVSSSTALQG